MKDGKRRSGKTLSNEDQGLWRLVTQQVNPLADRNRRPRSVEAEEPVPPSKSALPKSAATPSQLSAHPAARVLRPEINLRPASGTGNEPLWDPEASIIPGVDRRTARKLARGQMTVEATLDLHGQRQHEAQQALTRFVETAFLRGYRCVLVITGKGSQRGSQRGGQAGGSAETGVIRRRFMDWLAVPGLQDKVLAVRRAAPGDGGAGAFYLLLRRRR